MTPLEGLEISLTTLWEQIETVHSYVSKVVSDPKAEPKAAIGRSIATALAAIPHFEGSQFSKLFNESIQVYCCSRAHRAFSPLRVRGVCLCWPVGLLGFIDVGISR